MDALCWRDFAAFAQIEGRSHIEIEKRGAAGVGKENLSRTFGTMMRICCRRQRPRLGAGHKTTMHSRISGRNYESQAGSTS